MEVRGHGVNPNLDRYLFLGIAILGSVVTLATTGHLVGVRNDIYFQPILAALYDEPQFAHNLYIQSLHYYSSGLWQLLSGADRYVDPCWLLLGLHFVSELISFIGFLACATLLGIRTWQQRLLLVGLLCATSFLRGQSLAGDGGLFINYFTHSEVDNGLTLIALYLLLRRNLIGALVVEGIVVFLNAFIGVWDAVVMTNVAIAMALCGALTWRKLIVRGSVGVALVAALSLPILLNILANPDFGKPLAFDYVTYLEEFWPYHFLYWDIGYYERAGLTALFALGTVSFIALGKRGSFFIAAYVSFALVYAIGVVAPLLTHSPLVLNLHLLRVSTMLQLLGTFACLVLATRWWFSEKAIESNLLAPALVLIMCIPVRMTTIQPALHAGAAFLIVSAALLPTALQRVPEWLTRPALRLKLSVSTIVCVCFAVVLVVKTINNFRDSQWLAEWRAVGQWARSNTSSEDLFLLPTWSFRGTQSKETAEESAAILTSGSFEGVSHRAVWIDFRQGAAVMWSPSFYQLWHRRVTEVSSLNSIRSRLNYAAASGIKYVVDVCQPEITEAPAFSTRHLCVYATT